MLPRNVATFIVSGMGLAWRQARCFEQLVGSTHLNTSLSIIATPSTGQPNNTGRLSKKGVAKCKMFKRTAQLLTSTTPWRLVRCFLLPPGEELLVS